MTEPARVQLMAGSPEIKISNDIVRGLFDALAMRDRATTSITQSLNAALSGEAASLVLPDALTLAGVTVSGAEFAMVEDRPALIIRCMLDLNLRNRGIFQ
jgi:hypothetical protein